MSDDGRHGLAIIAMIGNVFSPYYYWAGRTDPLNHCALNIGLYGPRRNAWAMTERRRASLVRSASHLAIGPSAVSWQGGELVVDINEITVPFPSRIRGRVRLIPAAITAEQHDLDAPRRHQWWPIAPVARVEVHLESPALRWNGEAYLDSNVGEEPLEAGFTRWNWSRATTRDGAAVLYDVVRRDGSQGGLALQFDRAGRSTPFPAPPEARLPPTFWRLPRGTRADDGVAKIERTLEDAPFYARSIVSARLLGAPVRAVHESLDLDRFSSPLVKAVLPFRMPRALR